MKAKLRTALSFSAQDWSLLVQAWSLLLAFDVALRVLPFRKVQGWIKSPGQKEISTLKAEQIIRRSSHFVDLAARNHLYQMTCLRRSLALQWLLARSSLDTSLQFGVRRENGKLQAHAWLEHQGQVIDKTPIPIEQYTNLKAKEVA